MNSRASKAMCYGFSTLRVVCFAYKVTSLRTNVIVHSNSMRHEGYVLPIVVASRRTRPSPTYRIGRYYPHSLCTTWEHCKAMTAYYGRPTNLHFRHETWSRRIPQRSSTNQSLLPGERATNMSHLIVLYLYQNLGAD